MTEAEESSGTLSTPQVVKTTTTVNTTTIITTAEPFTDKILPYGLKGGFLIKQGKVVKNWKLRYFWSGSFV
jgi:hypothetical protein